MSDSMSDSSCPRIEELFEDLEAGSGLWLAHAKSCAACGLVLEEHRQLEKDLYRLADPLPPPDFVHGVMRKIAASPSTQRGDLGSWLSILTVAVMLSLALFFLGGGSLTHVGLWVARSAVSLIELHIALSSLLRAVWSTATLPFAACVTALVLTSVIGLRRLAGQRPGLVRISP